MWSSGRNGTSDISLTRFSVYTIPYYAILSHNWGADAKEVTFEDLTNGTFATTKLSVTSIPKAAISGNRYIRVLCRESASSRCKLLLVDDGHVARRSHFPKKKKKIQLRNNDQTKLLIARYISGVASVVGNF